MNFSRLKYFFWSAERVIFKLCLAAAYLLFNSTSLFSQNIYNLRIQKVQDEGLSNDYIFCINQDKNGFVWFGTGEGLYRYDGYSFMAFRNFPGNPATISNNAIVSLYPEKNNLWVGTRGGLNCIDINSLKVRRFPCREFLQIYSILPKNDSVLWVGTATGLYQFDKKKSQFKKAPGLKKNISITSVCNDKKGNLYISTLNGFCHYTIATGDCKYYQPDLPAYPKQDKKSPVIFRKTLLDHDGNLWMGTWDAGLVRFNTHTGQIKTWSHQTDDVHFIPYKIAIDLLLDNDKNIWIANKEGGLTIFNPSKNKFTNYPVEWKSDNQLSGSVIALFRDRSDIIWIGTENGVYKYDPHRVYLSRTDMRLKTDSGLVEAHISPITMLKDKDGVWWMGMYEGIFVFDQKKSVLLDYNNKLGIPKSSAVYNIIQDAGGTIWMTAKNMLVKVSKKASGQNALWKSEIFKSPDIQSSMYSLYIDNEKRIWIGTHSNGIFRFDPASKKFISCHYNVIGPTGKISEVRAFCELTKDSMLIAGEHTGLLLFHTNTGSFEKIRWGNVNNNPIAASINVLYRNGRDIWIGTEFNGLWKTDTHLKKPLIVTINNGLPSMDVNAIMAGKQNNLWLLTNAGVVDIHEPDLKITVFDKKDGIQSLNELYAMITDNNGNIIIGSRGAVYSFNPASIVKNKKPPEVLITDLKIFDKDYAIHNGETIKLNYNQNYFSFEYVALNYTQSKLNKYAYKMAGLDAKWNYAGSNRYVSYANLDDGGYVFLVKACNNEGVWNNLPAVVHIIIKPPFWRQWWFYLASVVLVLSGIYIVYKYNMNQFKMRLQLRDKIARDLHDDIGSTLSGINIFSKLALLNLDTDSSGSKELLKKISERSEKTLDALSDIVWSINTRNDGLDNFLMKAREYLAEALEPQGILYEINAGEDMEQLKIEMALRKELFLVFKEAIYNASKHARCTYIKISLSKSKDICKLSIHDNGTGFDAEKITQGNGIYNMKHRAQKINAEIDIKSRENEGTLVTVSFHIPRFR